MRVARDPIKERERLHLWYLANVEKVKEAARRWALEHPEKVLEAQARCRGSQRAKRRDDLRAWRAANPEKSRSLTRVGSSRRRARKRGAGGSHTAAEWIALCWASGWRCAYCGNALNERTAVQEHRVPLVRGGSDYIENIALSCAPCNSRKHAMTDVEFLQKKGCVS